jgi:hypothetical protein
MKPILNLLTVVLMVTRSQWSAAEPPHILIREAQQFENIGDSGRVPGTIWLLYQHLPTEPACDHPCLV